MSALRLVFMGTPEFAVPTLAALLDAGHEVIVVYSQPPRRAGRGQRTTPSPVHAFAQGRGIEVRTPRSLRDAEAQEAFARLDADAAVVVAYGLILPAAILEAPRLGCFNLHASQLPRWRGAAPIQRAIMAGDTETGVSVMRMDEGLDTGPVVLMARVPIGPGTTAGALHDELAGRGAALMVEALAGIAEGRLAPEPQPSDGVCYAAKIEKDEGRLDWHRPAIELERLIRALTPAPGAWFTHDGERLKVHAAEVVPEVKGAPGTLADDRLTVVCGAGGLRLTRVQRPGKAALAAEDFLRGHPLAAGTVLD
jgi:methionyl-tRNA formyltransferase